jgi:hypothetical protein
LKDILPRGDMGTLVPTFHNDTGENYTIFHTAMG